MHAENVRRKESIRARVPVRGEARIAGMIENRDADRRAIERAGIVDPLRTFAPNVLFALLILRAHHLAALLLFERRGQTNREHAFLGVAELHLDLRRERTLEIDLANLRVGVERHAGSLDEQLFAGLGFPEERRGDPTGLLPAREFADALQHDLAFPLPRPLLNGFVAPEVVAVDIAVREPEAAMMRVIVGLARDPRDHRELARDDLAVGRAQRMQVGLLRLGSYVEIGERLAIDLDGDLGIALLRDLDLRSERQRYHRQPNCAPHAATPAPTIDRISLIVCSNSSSVV